MNPFKTTKYMIYDKHSFQKEVMNKSLEKPMLVDFWAPWCGPCRALTPRLEQLAKEANGQWELVKVNVDENPEIAAHFSVRGIPSVKLVYMSQVIAAFTGSRPISDVRKWLGEHLPEVPEQEDNTYEATCELLKKGDIGNAAIAFLEQILEKRPNSNEAKALIAMLQLGKDNAKSKEMIDSIDSDSSVAPVAKDLTHLLEVLAQKGERVSSNDTKTHFSAVAQKDPNTKISLNSFDYNFLGSLVHDKINAIRKQRGLAALQTHATLQSVAKGHVRYQSVRGELTHTQDSPEKASVMDRIQAAGGSGFFRSVGENILLLGFPVRTQGIQRQVITPTYEKAATDIVASWVNSPGHYRNLLNPDFTMVGTGIIYNGTQNAVYATQVFGA